jgi:hypothetical protein
VTSDKIRLYEVYQFTMLSTENLIKPKQMRIKMEYSLEKGRIKWKTRQKLRHSGQTYLSCNQK